MTIPQDQQQVLEEHWEDARDRIQGLFPRLDEIDMSEWDEDLVEQIAVVTNTGVSEVEGRIGTVARELDAANNPEHDPYDNQDQTETPTTTTDATATGSVVSGDQGQLVEEPVQPDPEVRERNAPKRG